MVVRNYKSFMLKRLLHGPFIRLAKQYPVLTLTGPRQAGKTTLCQMAFPHHAYVNLEDLETRQFAVADPKGFLAQYSKGVILDEIQRAPDLPSYLQRRVDAAQKPGQFILTGSQQFEVTETINQSLAGRTAILKLLPFSLRELYPRGSQVPDSHALIYSGFYPRIHHQKLDPTEALSFYLATYVERDIRSLLHIKDLSAFERFLKLCAANTGQLLNYSSLGNNCGIDQKTVKSWLSLLEASYVVFQLRPYYQNFRKRLTKASKLYFYDVGLAAYLLSITSAAQVNQHPLRGALFENLVIAEFLKNRFNHVKENNLYFFRDHVGNKVDLLLDFGQSWITAEIKSSQTVQPIFFKGLHYMKTLCGKPNKEQWLIYGGERSFSQLGVNIYSYKDLPDIVK